MAPFQRRAGKRPGLFLVRGHSRLDHVPLASTVRGGEEKPGRAPRTAAKHEALGQELGFSSEDIWGMAAAMREHWQANAHLPASRKTDWDLAFNGWIRRECDYRKRRGYARPHEQGYAEMAEDIRQQRGGDPRETEPRWEDGDFANLEHTLRP